MFRHVYKTINIFFQALLLGIGLQHKSVDELEKEIELPGSQLMGLFNRVIRKVVQVSLRPRSLSLIRLGHTKPMVGRRRAMVGLCSTCRAHVVAVCLNRGRRRKGEL